MFLVRVRVKVHRRCVVRKATCPIPLQVHFGLKGRTRQERDRWIKMMDPSERQMVDLLARNIGRTLLKMAGQ